ncbi:MAG: hypothetical protein CM1200mP27_12700 [Chloroflexota bacterium]|nr:MAG: hypothetical protein CM1200mP27_12700 [Chloroflexota bacterium]
MCWPSFPGGVMGYWPGLEILELIDLTPRGQPLFHYAPVSAGFGLGFWCDIGLVAISAFSVGCGDCGYAVNTAEVLRSGN